MSLQTGFPGAAVGQIASMCGEAASLMIAHVVNGTQLSLAAVEHLTSTMSAKVQEQGGASTVGEEQDALLSLGIGSQQVSFDQMLANVQAGHPGLLEVSNGGALPGHTDKGLVMHFVAILGADSTGFWVGDSDTAAGASGQLIHETTAQLQAASPYNQATITEFGTVQGGPFQSPISNPFDSVQQFFSNVNTGVSWLHANWHDVSIRAVLIGFGALLVLIGIAMFLAPGGQRIAETAAPIVAAAS